MCFELCVEWGRPNFGNKVGQSQTSDRVPDHPGGSGCIITECGAGHVLGMGWRFYSMFQQGFNRGRGGASITQLGVEQPSPWLSLCCLGCLASDRPPVDQTRHGTAPKEGMSRSRWGRCALTRKPRKTGAGCLHVTADLSLPVIPLRDSGIYLYQALPIPPFGFSRGTSRMAPGASSMAGVAASGKIIDK